MNLEWTQPRADAEVKAKHAMEETRSALRRYPLWWIGLGTPALYYVYQVDPGRFWFYLLPTVTLALGLSWVLYQTLRDLRKIPQSRYQVGDKGLRINGYLHRWKSIAGYRFVGSSGDRRTALL